MTLIRRGKWSVCFKYDNVFIKEYIYPNNEAIEREISASKTCWDLGINTPKYLDTKIINRKVCTIFEYCNISPVYPDLIIDTPLYLNKIFNLLSSFERINWNLSDHYWHKLLNDFEDALSYIENNTNQIVDYLKCLEIKTFIHGDFTCDNIGISFQDIIIYDFQHGSLGPYGWDKAYFASTLKPEISKGLRLNNSEMKMAFAIAAIRYGRAIRKSSSDLAERKELYLRWQKDIRL